MDIVWTRTWPDKADDGTARCEALPDVTARVYLSAGGQDWYWFVNGRSHAISRGTESSKEEAKAAVEAVLQDLLTAKHP